MWITPARIFYAGLLGSPSVRRLGAWTIYFTCDAPLRLALVEGPEGIERWQEGELAIVPPYRQHRVGSQGRRLPDVLIEPESIDTGRLEDPLRDLLRGDGGVFNASHLGAARLLSRLREAHDRLASGAGPLPTEDADFDKLVFGGPLPLRSLDPRIARVLALLAEPDASTISAESMADAVHLSFFRFVHLFKDEVGVPLRTFRSWKRARNWLRYVTQGSNLTEIAHHTGYPDSAHFSRSIRQFFGQQPKDVMAGSRRLALHGERQVAAGQGRKAR
jgi:AraC-like DNA-binding protein